MSEKRFVAEQVDVVNEDETEVWDVVFDTENTYAFMVRDTDTASDLCDLLNEQQATISALKEENEQLKQSNDRFADTVAKQVSLLIELRKENEQLRQIIKDIVCATDETYTKNTSMFKVTVVFDGKMYNQIRSCLYE